MAHMGSTRQTEVHTYANHAHIMCFDCTATLVGRTTDHGLPRRLGRFSKDCPYCYERTFYNLPEPVALDPLPAPKPLPTLQHQVTMPAPLTPMERQYVALRYRLALALAVAAVLMWVMR
jgi:hypothetical protein